MEENKKNARIFYLTLAVVLTVVVVLVIATTVARRNSPITDTGANNTDTDTGRPSFNEDELPTFILPVSGIISVDYSDDVQVFSKTMNDYRTHLGVDIKSPIGSNVLAVADGVVTKVWEDPFMGTCVSIQHSGNAVSIYKNLAKDVQDGIVIGASVKSGDIIGTVGETAMNEIAEEPHLHYELKVNDLYVDPKEHMTFPSSDMNFDDEVTDTSN